MAIVKLYDMQTFLDEHETGNDDIIQDILDSTEGYVSSYCRRTFESTSYSLERYSTNGYQIINLKNYPVTAIDRVAVGTTDVITLTNTSSGTSASVTVMSTGLRLVLDGTADVSVTWAGNATISDVVTAINALGDGWSASLNDSTYGSFKSSDLVPKFALGCINSQTVYLQIPYWGEYDLDADFDRGQIRLGYKYRRSYLNIYIDYTAGYTADTMPEDLKLAVKIIVQFIYQKAKEGIFGVDLYNIGASGATGLRTVFEKGSVMPKEAELILSHYKRRLV